MPAILRPYQEDIKAKCYAEWNAGHKNLLLVLPTGMGKTVTFSSIAIDMAIDRSGPRHPTAIIVHRKELVQQISLTLCREGVKHNIIAQRATIKGIIASQRIEYGKQFYDYNAPISVISLDTLLSRLERHDAWCKTIRFFIIDEAAHVLASNKWGKTVAAFDNAIGLGVTATPERLDKRGLGRHADGIFDVLVQGPNTRWGIENGFLSDYRIAVPESDYRNYLAEAKGNADYTREAMAVASDKSHIVGDVVDHYVRLANGKQAIVFSTDISAGSRTESEFLSRGIRAKLLTSLTDDKDRLQSLIDYRERRTQVLINVDLFDEGLDVPGIECVIMARPTKSLGKYLQMIGRGLRIAKDKPYCIIIDHVANVKEHGLPDQFRRWTLDRIIKRRAKLNLVRICQNPKCNAPYDRVLTECPWCAHVPTPERSGGGGAGAGKLGPIEVDGDLELLDRETLQAMYDRSKLEEPAKVGQRVAAVAGAAAGLKAMQNQVERKKTQDQLAHTIALWAGQHRKQYSTRHIHKLFYLTFGMTMTEALSEPKADMERTKTEIHSHIY